MERTLHRMCNADKKIDVLFWANLHPNKRGSFEDYICRLSSFCRENGVRIKFVLGNQINDLVRTLFNKFRVDYLLFLPKKLNSITTMIKVLRDTKPKIVHFNFIGFASPLILLCKIMGVSKVVLTDHTSTSISAGCFQNGGLFESLKNVRRRFYIGKIDHFIAVSNFVGDRLQKRNGISTGKVNVIHNGVDLERFRPPVDELEKTQWKRNNFDVDESISVVTYIGQLTEEKGLLVFLESIRKLLRNHDEIIFALAGAGPLENYLQHYIEKTKNNKIKFLGFRDDTEFILRASDIVVVPSVWEEAFGLVIAEALACGVPVIGSRIGGIPEVLLDQKTGILTTPGNVDELVKAIEQLVYDKKSRNSFSTQGRKHVENLFDLKIQVSKTLNLYQHCLGRQKDQRFEKHTY